MVDALKIAAKVAVIAVVMVAVFAVFANVALPTIDTTLYLVPAVAKGKAIIEFWGGSIMLQWLAVAFILLGVRVGILGFKIAMIAVKWILKINE